MGKELGGEGGALAHQQRRIRAVLPTEVADSNEGFASILGMIRARERKGGEGGDRGGFIGEIA
jgi:hypothetical protein